MCAKAKISFLLCGRSGRQMRWPLTSDSSLQRTVWNSTRRYLKLNRKPPPVCCACNMQRATCNELTEVPPVTALSRCSASRHSGMPTGTLWCTCCAACTHHTNAQAALGGTNGRPQREPYCGQHHASRLTVASAVAALTTAVTNADGIAPERFSKLAPFIIFAMTFSRMSPLRGRHANKTQQFECPVTEGRTVHCSHSSTGWS